MEDGAQREERLKKERRSLILRISLTIVLCRRGEDTLSVSGVEVHVLASALPAECVVKLFYLVLEVLWGTAGGRQGRIRWLGLLA